MLPCVEVPSSLGQQQIGIAVIWEKCFLAHASPSLGSQPHSNNPKSKSLAIAETTIFKCFSQKY